MDLFERVNRQQLRDDEARRDARRLTRYILIHGAKPVAERPYIEKLPPGTEIYKIDEVRAWLQSQLDAEKQTVTFREPEEVLRRLLQELEP